MKLWEIARGMQHEIFEEGDEFTSDHGDCSIIDGQLVWDENVLPVGIYLDDNATFEFVEKEIK